jgi:hypothetical protein
MEILGEEGEDEREGQSRVTKGKEKRKKGERHGYKKGDLQYDDVGRIGRWWQLTFQLPVSGS